MDPNDKGRRKYALSIIAMVLIFVGYLAIAGWAGLAPSYGTLITGLAMVAASFHGANVWEKLSKKPPSPAPKP